MRSTAAIGFVLAIVAARVASAQDEPPFPYDRPEAASAPGPWSRGPNRGYGLLNYVPLGFLPSLRSGFEIRFPTSLAADAFELRIQESWVNNLAVKQDWAYDFELARSNVSFGWGLTDELRADLAVETAERTGGRLDALILGFHQTFGLTLGNRTRFGRDANHIAIRPSGSESTVVVDDNDPQAGVQALLLTLQHTPALSDGSYPSLCWSLTMRRELSGGDLKGGGPVDLGASLGLLQQAGDFTFYAGGRAAWFGQEDFFGLKLRSLQWAGLFGGEWRMVPTFALIVQYQVTSGGADGLGALSRPSHEIVAGFKWDVGRGVLLELGIIENILNPDNSPDFGVHGGITFRW